MLNKDLNLIRISYSYLILISNRLHSNSLIFELYSNISLLNFGSETVRRVVGWLVSWPVCHKFVKGGKFRFRCTWSEMIFRECKHTIFKNCSSGGHVPHSAVGFWLFTVWKNLFFVQGLRHGWSGHHANYIHICMCFVLPKLIFKFLVLMGDIEWVVDTSLKGG